MSLSRSAIIRVMNSVVNSTASCPCHGGLGPISMNKFKTFATPSLNLETDYAFEVAASNIRFGEGATKEVAMDCLNFGAKRVGIITDSIISKLLPMQTVIESLDTYDVKYEFYDQVRIEPTDISFKHAIEWAKMKNIDCFIAVGGGSVMDTAKVANLYSCYPDADFLDFVNQPLGKGRPIDKKLFPLIAIPTTAGTGSETTGVAIFDYTPMDFKTGIAHRVLKPSLGIVDPLNTRSMPSQVHCSSGLDILCHSLESYTTIPYNERKPRPSNPILRPSYQGRNPISDVFSLHALKQTVKYLARAIKGPEDREAQSNMLLASTLAGIGFGNAGLHLPHGMSYAVSGLNKKITKYKHPGYNVEGRPIVPHGISVAVNAPAVFKFTAPSDPERHMEAARIFGYESISTQAIKKEMVGEIIYEQIAKFLSDLPDVPRGLSEIGYRNRDIDALVEGTLPQRRVLDLAPGDNMASRETLAKIFEKAMKF